MGSTGSGGGSTANVFAPPGQAAAAGALGQIANPLFGISQNAGAGTPAAWSYPQAQGFSNQAYNPAAQYLTGSPTGAPTLFDQSAGLGYGSATNAANMYANMMGQTYGQIPGLTQAASSAFGYMPQVMQSAFNPLYQQQVDAAQSNPFYQPALEGAQRAATLGGQGANQLYGAGSSILQQGFDPQSALFNRTQQQLTDQLGAVNAMTGVGSSPYGAGVMGKGLSDFDINWQNQQLGRQTSAAGAASPLLQAAPGLAASTAALPSQTYMGHIGDILKALQAQQQAQGQGVSQFGSLLSGAGSSLGQAQNLLGSSTGGLASSGMLPYQSGATMGQNALQALGGQQGLLNSATQLGNNQYQLPEQMMQDLMKYMGLGQSASGISGNLGQMGFNQAAQGIGGGLSGLNSMFGSNGMFGSGGGLGSMLGGGGLDAWDTAVLAGTAEPMAASMAGGSMLSSLAPMALSGSDRRIKRDIKRIGTLPSGLPFYSFRYLWDDAPQIGLMADEVEKVHPGAVIDGPFGYKMVNYAVAMR